MHIGHLARGAISAERARLRMQLRGTTPNGHPLWTLIEAGRLRHGYPDYRAVMALNIDRSRPAHYGKAGRLGITKPRTPAWSDSEILLLRKLYPLSTKEDLLQALPNRSWQAITAKALHRGLQRPPRPLKPTGDFLLDQIRARAQQWGVSMKDLDRDTSGAGYFSRRKWRNGTLSPKLHLRAVAVLGGHVRFTAGAN